MNWRRKWQSTPVFLPGESQGRGSLVGCRLWDRTVGHDCSNLATVAAASRSLYLVRKQAQTGQCSTYKGYLIYSLEERE